VWLKCEGCFEGAVFAIEFGGVEIPGGIDANRKDEFYGFPGFYLTARGRG